tara:strand:+ start:292 stop:762 length:471 start_codon:yes stop_codon:yes gene_type:complete
MCGNRTVKSKISGSPHNPVFDFNIPLWCITVLDLLCVLKTTKYGIDASSQITLFVTKKEEQQRVFKQTDTIDDFIEKSQGGIVTIFVKKTTQRLPSNVIEEKTAIIDKNTGTTIDLGCGASVYIPPGALLPGQKIVFQEVKGNGSGISPTVCLKKE